MSVHDLAQKAWETYLKDTYVNNQGQTKPTFASKWRKSNPNAHAALVAYKNGTHPRPWINDGYGPIILCVVDLWIATRPTTPPPPPTARFAPMTHHIGANNQDPCFCMKPEYGVVWDAARGLYVDQRGATYDIKGRLNSGRDRYRKLPFLKGAESMDNLEPCDQYVGPTGMLIGGSAGYPPACFEF